MTPKPASDLSREGFPAPPSTDSIRVASALPWIEAPRGRVERVEDRTMQSVLRFVALNLIGLLLLGAGAFGTHRITLRAPASASQSAAVHPSRRIGEGEDPCLRPSVSPGTLTAVEC